MITSVLSKRRSIPVVVRRGDAEAAIRGRRQSSSGSSGRRRNSRRARRRGLFTMPTRSGWIAIAVLVAAAIAWLATFAYLASLA